MNRRNTSAAAVALSLLTVCIAASVGAPAVARAQTDEAELTTQLTVGSPEKPPAPVELHKDATGEIRLDARRHRRRGGILLGAGIPLTVAGGVSLGLFGLTLAHYQRLDEGMSLWLAGSVTAITFGLVLTGLGAWQRLRGNRLLRALSSVELGVVEGGASVGWSGTF